MATNAPMRLPEADLSGNSRISSSTAPPVASPAKVASTNVISENASPSSSAQLPPTNNNSSPSFTAAASLNSLPNATPSQVPAANGPAPRLSVGSSGSQHPSSPAASTLPSPTPSKSKRRNTAHGLFGRFKSFAFNSVIAARWNTSVTEEEKVAYRQDRRYAIGYVLLIHFLPATAALALIVVNCQQYYVGGELAGKNGQDDQKLGALTFAAKLHELLMLASLAAALFAYLRTQLLYGEGLPFGAVSGGLQFKEFSFLYSPELWSAFSAEWSRQRDKWTTIILLVTCTFLGVSVGPSTNNLIRPRLDWWDAGGTTYWINATTDLLLANPMQADASMKNCKIDTGDAACPHGDWEVINRLYHSFWPYLQPMGNMPDFLVLTSPFSTRQMTLRHRSTVGQATRSLWANAFSMASIQHSVVADGLAEVGRLWAYAAANAGERQKFVWRKDARYLATAYQPLAQARCEETTYIKDVTDIHLNFPIFPALTCDGDDSNCSLDPTQFYALVNESWQDNIRNKLTSGSLPAVTWLDLDIVPASMNSSIHAVVTFPTTTDPFGFGRFYCCSIDSAYIEADIFGSRGAPKLVTGYPGGMLGLGTSESGAQRINITAAWAQYLFPQLPTQNATAFSKMVSTAGMWNSYVPSQTYNFPFIVESILATSITNGLARSTYNRTMLGTLKGNSEATCDGSDWCGGSWEHELLPRGNSLGWGGSAYDINAQDQESATMITMYATVNGYAWSYQGTLQKTAIAVLSVYVLFAVTHSLYLVLTGRMSLSWDNAPEMISLAMNSQATTILRNTGAGIDTVQPFRAMVKIRVGPQGHLELIFDDPTILPVNLNIVQRNERYP